MSSDQDIVLNVDENARDEFSAQKFFQRKKPIISDITNSQFPYGNISFAKNTLILSNKADLKKCILTDVTNTNSNKLNNDIFSLKRKKSSLLPEILDKKTKKICVDERRKQNDYFVPFNIDYNYKSEAELTGEFDSLSSLNNIYTASEFTCSLSKPANGYNKKYCNQIAVPEPWKCEKLLKVEYKSAIWNAMIETAKVETRILSSPCRKTCSPYEQYSITPTLQYKSDCLINAFHSPLGNSETFPNAISADSVYSYSRRHPNDSHPYMPESINIYYFHELYLEKLPCNQLYDFMPQSKELTGVILGGFINDIFELAYLIYLPNEVIHMAVDFIYQYLSRVLDVPLNDLKLITLGAIWMASKYEGYNYKNSICQFSHCSFDELKHGELRLNMVIDFNLTKPNAIHIRNRCLIIDSPTSITTHLSNFILDMTLHCYTVMILPSSMRATAALWLSRLIEKFEDVRFNNELSGDEVEGLRQRMDSVWPDHYHKLSGYHHSEISLLAIRMHVIVLAFLCHEQKKKSSVNACYNRYSTETYKNLTGSYAKFTSRIVYFCADLYCNMHNLVISEWLDKKEFETLQMTVCDSKPSWRRSNSSFVSPIHQPDMEANSCPELTARPLVRNSSSQDIMTKDRLVKFDSGYSTCSNHTMDTN